MGRKKVTLSDVAQDAGVSRSTASLVLRNSPLVADDTRERVMKSMRKLNYVYNLGAASLRTQRTYSIGLVLPAIIAPYFGELTLGIEEPLDRANYAVLLAMTFERLDKQERLVAMMQQRQMDGIILCPAMDTPIESLERLIKSQIPTVLVTRPFDVDLDYVGQDNTTGTEIAVEHLIRCGHTHIAYLGPRRQSLTHQARYQGYQNALARHNITPDPSLTIAELDTRTGGYYAVKDLMALENPPTAVFCYDDTMAFGVMQGLRESGLHPGKDIAVIGFNDVAEAVDASLTTVACPPRAVGDAAARLLLERIENPDAPPQRIIVPGELVRRGTCGCS